MKISLFDAMGQLVKILKDVWHGHGTYVVDLDVVGLRSGNYYVQLSQGDKRITEVLLVQ